MRNLEIEKRLALMADAVDQDETRFGVLSTGERIAVALVLERPDLLKKDGWTILKAVDRLGPEWTAAAREVQRDR